MAVNPKDVSNVQNRMAISRAMAQAKQPFRPGPVIASDWPLDRRRVQAEQAIGLPRPDQAASPIVTHRPLAGADANYRGTGKILVYGDGTSDAASGRPSTPLAIYSTPKDSGEDAEAMEIVCGLELLSTSNYGPTAGRALDTNPTIVVQATIEWGIGGVTFSADIDWIQGQILTVPASWLTVKAGYTGYVGGLSLAPPDIRLSAAAAYGGTGKHNTARKTKGQFDIAHGATTSLIQVPPFAKAFALYWVGTGSPNLTITLLSGDTQTVALFEYTDNTNTARQDNTFPIAANVNQLKITNNDDTNGAEVFVIFYLDF